MNIQIEWEYKAKNGAQTVFTSEQLPAAQVLMIVEDLMLTGRAKKLY